MTAIQNQGKLSNTINSYIGLHTTYSSIVPALLNSEVGDSIINDGQLVIMDSASDGIENNGAIINSSSVYIMTSDIGRFPFINNINATFETEGIFDIQN